MTATQTPRLTPQDQQDDEIDLFELWDQLIAEKLTIILSAVIVVVLAAGYAFLVTPTFKASSFLMPPLMKDISSVNQLGLLVENEELLKPEYVFNLFKINLTSKESLKFIYDQYMAKELYDASYEALSKQEQRKRYNSELADFISSLSVNFFDKKHPLQGFSVDLALELPEEQVIDAINDLVEIAKNKTTQQLYSQANAELQSRISILQSKISGAREVEEDRRFDKIARITEALAMTESLGIKKSILNGPTLNVVDGNLPLYMLGSDLLLAEKKVLEMRKNDDPFIAGLRDWQEELSLLSSITIESDKFAVVRVDSVTDYAEKIKPKKALILAVAGVLGLMLGVFVALIRSAVKRRKAKFAAV